MSSIINKAIIHSLYSQNQQLREKLVYLQQDVSVLKSINSRLLKNATEHTIIYTELKERFSEANRNIEMYKVALDVIKQERDAQDDRIKSLEEQITHEKVIKVVTVPVCDRDEVKPKSNHDEPLGRFNLPILNQIE